MSQASSVFRILIVEDDPMYQRMIRYVMELNPDHEVTVCGSGKECLRQLDQAPHLISIDYSLPDMTGKELLDKIKAFDASINLLILSGQQDIKTAVQLLKNGADDYITKDEETKDRVLHAVARIKQRRALEQEVDQLRTQLETKYEFGNMVGQSKAMQPVFRLLKKAAGSNINVSVTGETGTGKEVVAKSIHYNSARQKGRFVAVNMGAIPAELLESELFGHEKGAFTGAVSRKKGQFELANGGTLFLDEIAEMDLNLQAKLLRAIQEREVQRVGGEKPIAFDARLIIATHKNLAEEVKAGRFREDLYYRLLGLNVELPPLRERGRDVLLLANFFLADYIKQNKLPALTFSKTAKTKLLAYHYPGNVRELRAAVELAAVMAENEQIMAEDVQFRSVMGTADLLTREMTLEGYKQSIIRHYLDKYDQNVLLVAQKLDIGKSTIYRMLQEEKM